MTSPPTTLVTQEMIDRRNVWSPPRVSPPISLSDIRKWAIAVYWPETPPRLYWDEEYAKTTRFGGIIAPQDFNPFAWPAVREQMGSFNASATSATVGQRAMNGGQTDVYHAPMRPGDVISSSSALVDWNERQGRLGLTLFSSTENRWTNQRGELVKTRTSVSIRY
jgi:acyl dehydratase